MPYSLPSPVSRRRFLLGSVSAAAATLAAPQLLQAAARSAAAARGPTPVVAGPLDPDRVVLLSDAHIAASPRATSRGVNMFDNLWRAGEEIASSGLRPTAALVTGDLSVTAGKTGDYATFARAITPLRAPGMPPLYLGMGNHDHFGRFQSAFPEQAGVVAPAGAKQVTVVETARANLLLLDSLGKTNASPGNLGSAQLAQLAADLDARRDKPAIVLIHHNPERTLLGGLTDSAAFFDVIVPRKHVKSVVFGHTHVWSAAMHEGIHLINLPPTAYVFGGRDPNGWTDLLLKDNGATFTLHALDKARNRNGERFDVSWRADA